MLRIDSEQKRIELKGQTLQKTNPVNGKRCQATAESVFNLARKQWLMGKRINIADIAKDAGVSRITLYRWFGNRDQLIEDILWSIAGPEFQRLIRDTPGIGIDHIINVHRSFMIGIARLEPLRQFIINNPTEIIRCSTTDPKSSHGRHTRAVEAHLLDQAARGHINLPISACKLAETMVYTNAVLLYSAIIGGHSLSVIELACAIDRAILVSGIPDDPTIF